MRIGGKKNQACKNHVQMPQHRHLRAAGRIDHRGKTQAGLLCDELAGELKDHEGQTQHHADGGADDHLLHDRQQTVGGQRIDEVCRVYYRRQHASEGEHQDQARAQRQRAGAEHRRRHHETTHAQKRPHPLRQQRGDRRQRDRDDCHGRCAIVPVSQSDSESTGRDGRCNRSARREYTRRPTPAPRRLPAVWG